ncbi:protein stum [Galleria mellonella]|uniref:Protein stum n=1 Tax=Galleria mellonella TaxID=7137 RepID=A0ABM3M906_GALME|nr:protein stum [Galleria mellonella]
MALKLKYKDEHGILHINMSPSNTPQVESNAQPSEDQRNDITDPKFDTINNRFAQYDLFGGKYDTDGGETPRSLFRSRYNSIEEELANTPYAFATERSLRLNNLLDITIQSRLDEPSPSKDIEDDRYFNRSELFGPQIDFKSSIKTSDEDETPAFTVTQLIHAQDRYFDLSSRQSSSVVESPKDKVSFEVKSVGSGKERTVRVVGKGGESEKDEAFRVLSGGAVRTVPAKPASATQPVVPTSKRKRESSFAIIAETPVASRPSSPRSLPVEIRPGRVSPFKGRGFREETSRHTTPKTSAANSRTNSPPRRRTNSLSKIDKMAQAATLQPLIHTLSRPHSPRNFLKENIEEIRELSELNREKHEAEAQRKKMEEEEALLKEMGLLDKNARSDAIRSVVCSRTTSRSNSPNKINLRSRSNSPSAILHFENIPPNSKEYINQDDGMPKPVTHKSRIRSVSRSQPQSNDGSPKHSSKIPKRQNSVSPSRRDNSKSRLPENSLNKNQRFISNSTSSIHETIKVGSQVHDKRAISKSTQFLNIAPAHIRGKPPISPGRGGPPPANKAINSKRLSPIVGTPNKSPIEDLKPKSAKTPTKPSPVARKPIKTAGNTPATSRFNSRQPSRAVSRDPSPDKRKAAAKVSSTSKSVTKTPSKPITRTPSSKSIQKPIVTNKPEPKKPINRTNSVKSLTRTPSTKTLYEKPPLLKKRDSKKDLTEKSQSMNKINEVGAKKDERKPIKSAKKDKDLKDDSKKKEKGQVTKSVDSCTGGDEVTKQDNETQYDKITNEKGELVILTKKSVVSMTTAAITSQPLEVVTTVTNQLPTALEKAREKGIFERLSSKESLAPKDEEKEDERANSEIKEVPEKAKEKENEKDKEKDNGKEKGKNIEKRTENEKESVKELDKEKSEKVEEKKPIKPTKNPERTIFADENVKLKLLQPPYNNPQVEKVRQKIENILKEPEVSTENILAISPKAAPETKNTLKNVGNKTKTEIKETKDEVASKLTDIKNEVVKQNDKMAAEIRSEASKIVDSIMTPIENPKVKEIEEKKEPKKEVEPIVVVVNEKKKNGPTEIEKMTETLVKGEPEVEVQSSNLSTPGTEKMVLHQPADGSASDKSTHSNGGFPQSTSTTPKPPARAHRKQSKEDKTQSSNDSKEPSPDAEKEMKKPNICSRLVGKCKKCCSCCVKGETDDSDVEAPAEKRGTMSRLNCCKKKEKAAEDNDVDIEKAAGKAATIQFESETKRKRKFRDVLCGCCGRKRRVSDVSDVAARNVAEVAASPEVVSTGCCGKRRHEIERRDSILSDRPPANCCTRMCTWVRGACRRHSEQSSSRRTSMFSKNKSLSPTLPPEDTRKKLDTSLIEHTSVMRGAIPVLPTVLAYFCLFCNIIVPGLGTIFSGMFCLCFGIPRFGVHDGAKHRIGSFLINLLVGCGQLFTVLFCLVGWGWSIWWGVIFVKVARKYRKLKAEAAAEEAEAAPPVTANNHTRT